VRADRDLARGAGGEDRAGAGGAVSPPPVARQLAEHLAGLDFATLPAPVVAMAKRLTLDTLMVAWAGADADGVGAIRRMVAAEGSQGRSTLWADGRSCAPAPAALANGVAAAALDFDSLNGSVHADIVVLPAALAVAEATGASGRDLIAAHVAGVELVGRLAAAVRGPQKGWTHSAVLGVFGAAAAAGRLLGLDAEHMTHAFGLCLPLAGGTQQANVEQALTKRLQPALAARNGVFAALAAEAGITAPAGSIDGRFGLWALYQPGDAAALLDGLGERFVMLETGLKKYPVCACSHAPMETLLALGLAAEDVTAIEVALSPFANRLVGTPFDPRENPQVTAQFSIQYALAALLLRGRLGIEALAPEAVRAPEIAALAARIRVVVDERYTGELIPARLTIETRRHGRIERMAEIMPGSAATPLSEAELMAKLDHCRGFGPAPMPPERLHDLIDAVAALDRRPDVTGFVSTHLSPRG